jgi:N-acetylglucosaminyl-diphospho-decaprenol L-rhamnosyltransferase
VVIVAWNVRPFLEACLRSIFDHDGPGDPGASPGSGVEVFVVDNGSTDGSAEMIAEEFPRVRLIREPKNRGYPAANNIALRAILAEKTADVVILMNSDIVARDHAVDRLAGHLARHPGVAAVLPALVLPDGRFQIGVGGFLPTAGTLFSYFFGLHKLFPVRARSLFIDQKSVAKRVPYLSVEWLSGACLAVRREAVERIGLMSEDYFFYAEDLDWGRRMKAAGLTLRYWPGVRVVHHHGATYQDVYREVNTAWLRMLFRYVRAERGRADYVLSRLFASAGFLARTIAHAARSFPWTRKASRRKVREVFRFFVFSLTGV